MYLIQVDEREEGQSNIKNRADCDCNEEYSPSDTGSSCLQLITIT